MIHQIIKLNQIVVHCSDQLNDELLSTPTNQLHRTIEELSTSVFQYQKKNYTINVLIIN